MAQAKKQFFKKPEIRLSIIISGFMIVIALITLLFWMAQRSLFSRNDNFILNHVKIKSAGYWNSKEDEIIKIMGLQKGATNLFDLKPQELREKLMHQSNIEKVTVARILPDCVEVDISERLPRALLYRSDSRWVVDSECIVMEADKVFPPPAGLPVITGLRFGTPSSGANIPELRPALELILMAVKDYPSINIQHINIVNPDEIQVYLQPEKSFRVKVLMPPVKLEEKLAKLDEFLKIHFDPSKEPDYFIDLRFENRLILTPEKRIEPNTK